MRVLFLTTLLPGMRRTGSEVASQAFADALRAAGHDVTLLGYRRAGTDPPLAWGDVAVSARHIETSAAGLRPLWWMARGLLSRRPYTLAKYEGRAYRRAIEAAVAAAAPALVVLDHAQVAALGDRDWGVPVVYIAHNVEHRLHSGGWVRSRERRLLEAVERGLVERADETWTLTAGDARELGRGAARTRVFDLPPASVPAAPGAPEYDVVLLGGWHWRPNAAGLRWFVEEVAPRLGGELDVVVGGADGEGIVGARPGVRAVGPVPDALAFLQRGRVVAVPSVEGGGVQVKTLDAIASGRRVVATPTAMRGIDGAPRTVQVAEDAAGFAVALRSASAAADGAATEARAWAADRTERFRGAVAAAVEALAR